MSFKLLNKIGIKDDEVWFNRDLYIDQTPHKKKFSLKRIKQWKKERKEYGFDSRECWDLDTSASQWLYCHLVKFKEDASKIVDLSYKKFDIPVVMTTPKSELVYTKHELIADNYTYEKIINVTLGEAIDWCILYLKEYIRFDEFSPVDTDIDEMKIVEERGKCAFKIFSIILPWMWW